MGIGTLRRYHYKDVLHEYANKLRLLADEIDGLRHGNELDKEKLSDIANRTEKTTEEIMKELNKGKQ